MALLAMVGASVVPAGGAQAWGGKEASAEGGLDALAWIEGTEPVARALGAERALRAGSLAGALAASAGLDAARAAPLGAVAPNAASLAGVPAEIRGIVDAVLRAAAIGAGDRDEALAGALLVLEAIDAAQPRLALLPRGPDEGHGAIDAHELERGLGQLVEARLAGTPFEVDAAKMKAYEDWILNLTEPVDWSVQSIEFHHGIQARLPHAVEQLVPAVQAFLAQVEAVRAAAEGPMPRPPPPGCVEPVPGVVRYCDLQSQTLVTPVMLHIDQGGNDVYLYGAGAASGPGAVQIVLDLAGSDTYLASGFGQGAGENGGIGILVDNTGNDLYVVTPAAGGSARGQGYGSGGVGVLADRDGTDTYALVASQAVTVDGSPFIATAISAPQAVRGQGAAERGGVGAQLDAAGHDFYSAVAVSFAQVNPSFFSPQRPAGAVIVHTASAGDASVLAQGAAVGPLSAGVHVDAPAATGPQPPNLYTAFAASQAVAFELSVQSGGGSRTCDASSGRTLVQAQGFGADLGVGAHASAATTRFADSTSFAFAECFELSSTISNNPMRGISRTGDSDTAGQGAGSGLGAGGLVQLAGGASQNHLFADSVSVACDQCFQSGGTCTAEAFVGKANVRGQGSGSGGVGALLSRGASDLYNAGAFESGNAWTFAVLGGVGIATAKFGDSPAFNLAPFPSARVQGYGEPAATILAPGMPGAGAIVDVDGKDTYATANPGPFGGPQVQRSVTVFSASTPWVFGSVLGLDLDKAELGGKPGVAVLADLDDPLDAYLESGNPASGAANAATWGAGISVSPLFVERGIDLE